MWLLTGLRVSQYERRRRKPMLPAVPNYDLGILITIDIGIGLLAVLTMFIGVWGIMRQNLRSQEIAERVAGIAERLDARLRRQYADIDRDLQDIKERLP